MAFRSQTKIGVLIAFTALQASAAEFRVRHEHLHGSSPGVLKIDNEGVDYRETKKAKHPHEYRWGWNDIQRLDLSPDRLEIVTYKDEKWLAGRDKRFSFRGEGIDSAYAILSENLPRRFVPDLARMDFDVIAKLPAKRLEGNAGHEGTLFIGGDRLVFRSESVHGSHTWALGDVENVSSSDPLQLTVASLGTDYRIQLKQPMPENVYNDLWRKLNLRRTH